MTIDTLDQALEKLRSDIATDTDRRVSFHLKNFRSRTCRDCGADIENRNAAASLCEDCVVARRIKRNHRDNRQWEERYRATIGETPRQGPRKPVVVTPYNTTRLDRPGTLPSWWVILAGLPSFHRSTPAGGPVFLIPSQGGVTLP